MIPKSGNRFPAFAKPAVSAQISVTHTASAGEGRSDKIMLNRKI
jgi:hypothetical protein